MNLSIFSLDTILLVLVFVIPGNIFFVSIAKWGFPSGRENLNKLARFTFSIIFSIAIVIFFDWLTDSTLTKGVIKEISTKDTRDPSQLTKLLSVSILKLMPFSFIFSILMATLIHFLDKFSRWKGFSYLDNYFSIAVNCIYGNLIDKMENSSCKCIRWLKCAADEVERFYLKGGKPASGKDLILSLFSIVIHLLFVIYLLLILIFEMVLPPARILIYKVFTLFQHSLYVKFFNLGNGLPIVEILRREDRVLCKGIIDSFEPLNHSQIASISLKHVMQYKLKEEKNLFHRGDRVVYIFNNTSILTIPRESIADFNLSQLDIDGSNYIFYVDDENSLRNQVWYIDIIAKSNRTRFIDLELNISCTYKLFFRLQHEIVDIINQYFSEFPYQRQKRKLLKQLMSNAEISHSLMIDLDMEDTGSHERLKEEYKDFIKRCQSLCKSY